MDDAVTIDMSALQDVAGDDISAIKPILELFLTNIADITAKMKGFYRERDWENLYKAAHSAKSSVSVIQVDDLYQLYNAIEVRAKNRVEPDTIKALLESVESKYKKSEALLKKVINSFFPE